ncbi:MAG: winged helix-turn-helix domain-containing protein [Halorhabdus sp.]
MSTKDARPLTPDDVFDILSNPRRRMVLYYLREHAGSVDVKELAEAIAAMENDVDVSELTSQQRKRVYVSLYQTHLPKMAETGVIDYDKDGGTVRLTDRTTAIDEYLTTEGPSYPWRLHYLVIAAVGFGALVLSTLEVFVFASVSPVWVGVGVLSLAVVSTVVQYVQRSTNADVPIELRRQD